MLFSGFPWWLNNKESACNAIEVGSIPGSGRSPGEGNGNPLQYSCLENFMDRGTWWVTVRRTAKSQIQLKQLSTHTCMEQRWASLLAQSSACQYRRPGFDPRVGKMPWRRKWQPAPVFLPGESHGQRSLAGYSLRGHKESDMTEQLTCAWACMHTHTHTHTHRAREKGSHCSFKLLVPAIGFQLIQYNSFLLLADLSNLCAFCAD